MFEKPQVVQTEFKEGSGSSANESQGACSLPKNCGESLKSCRLQGPADLYLRKITLAVVRLVSGRLVFCSNRDGKC